jgi:TRAP-type C4-dicarboxylate transport system substrate-binding protein
MLIKSLIILFIILSVSISHAETSTKKPIVLKWMIAHDPNNYFIEMAKYLKSRVEKETNGEVQVKIVDNLNLNYSRYFKMSNARDVNLDILSEEILQMFSKHQVPQISYKNLAQMMKTSITPVVFLNRLYSYFLMLEGKIDMAQGYTYFLAKVANPEYHALELPYVFDNYDHINNFFNSDVAKNLLTSTAEEFGFRGLAFTFSGGLLQTLSLKNNDMSYRNHWSTKRFRHTDSIVRDEYIKYLGGIFVDSSVKKLNSLINTDFKKSDSDRLDWGPVYLIKNEVVDVEEINLPDVEKFLSMKFKKNKKIKEAKQDLYQLSLSETQHTLLSTVFMINEKTYQKLSPKQREILQSAAIDAATMERKLTLNRYEAAKKVLRKKDFKIYTITDNNKLLYRRELKPFYDNIFKLYPNTIKIYEAIDKARMQNNIWVAK